MGFDSDGTSVGNNDGICDGVELGKADGLLEGNCVGTAVTIF